MQNLNRTWARRAAAALTAGMLATTLTSCEDGVGGIAEQCGLTCPAEGVLEGNASISGIGNIDAFFDAVVQVRTTALDLQNGVRAELEGLAALLGIEGTAEMDLPTLSAEVKAALEAKFSANVQGGVDVRFNPPRCEADIEVTARATARCDAEVDPGSVQVACEGKCEVNASVAAECQAEGNLECRGTAPNLECSGSCQGTCRLEVAATCEGVCNGTCNGECSSESSPGVCNGSCDGTCEGTCELNAGGSCSGSCEGECTYTPPTAECEAGAKAVCNFEGQAEAKCEGKCEGEVTPPSVKAECEAAVDASAKADLRCTPPELDVNFTFAAGVDANAQAEFRAFIRGFKGRFSAILALRSRLEALGRAAENLGVAATGAVQTSFDTALGGDIDLKTSIGLSCALAELDDVGTATSEAVTSITASTTAVGEVVGTVGTN